MKYTNVKILSNDLIAEDIFSMNVDAPEIAPDVLPGQFAMVYLPNGELLLPRPISICDADDGQLRFVYQVVGTGTKVMSKLKLGGMVQILAPLGRGFFTTQARTPLNKVALVGGGIGTPPLLLLAKTLKAQGSQVDAYLGFRKDTILTREFENIVDRLYTATEYGNTGYRGRVLEIVESLHIDYDEILACGPRPMLNAVANYAASRGIPCQISTEERMACGLGTCVGCVLSVRGSYVRICTEGPVFYSDEISSHPEGSGIYFASAAGHGAGPHLNGEVDCHE